MESSTALLMRWLGLFALGLAVMSASVLMAVCGSGGGAASSGGGTGSEEPALSDRLPWVAMSADLGPARSNAWGALLSAFAPSRTAPSSQEGTANTAGGVVDAADGADHGPAMSVERATLSCTSPLGGSVVWATE